MIEFIRRRFVVDVPLAVAWQHLALVEQWPSWAKHIKSVDLDPRGELTKATVGEFHLQNGLRTSFRMVEINAPQNWKWIGPFLWLTIHYDHRFEIESPHQTSAKPSARRLRRPSLGAGGAYVRPHPTVFRSVSHDESYLKSVYV